MNKKQIICMWLGIVAIVLPATITILDSYGGFYRWVFIQVLITGGLIVTFRDKKLLEGQKQKVVNLKRGFRRLVLVSSILLSIFVAVIVYMCVENPKTTMKWSGVQNSEKFKALNQQQQADVKLQFWDNVISKDTEFQTFNQAEQEAVKHRFFGIAQLPPEQAQTELRKHQAIISEDIQNVSTEDLLTMRQQQQQRLENIQQSHAELQERGAISTPNYNFTATKHGLAFVMLRCIISGVLFFGAIWLIYFILEWVVLGFCDNNRLRPEKT